LAFGGVAAAGVVLGVVGWYQASGRALPSHQSGPAVLSAIGALLVLGAVATWLGSFRRAVLARSRRLLGAAADSQADRGLAAAPIAVSTTLVAGTGLRFYHRADCLLAPARTRKPRPGQEPCGVCRPEPLP
jgi:uncharacterized membrane protein